MEKAMWYESNDGKCIQMALPMNLSSYTHLEDCNLDVGSTSRNIIFP